MSAWESVLAAELSSHHHVTTRKRLQRLGVSRRVIDGLCQRGRLEHIGRGVLVCPSGPATFEQRLAVACALIGRGNHVPDRRQGVGTTQDAHAKDRPCDRDARAQIRLRAWLDLEVSSPLRRFVIRARHARWLWKEGVAGVVATGDPRQRGNPNIGAEPTDSVGSAPENELARCNRSPDPSQQSRPPASGAQTPATSAWATHESMRAGLWSSARASFHASSSRSTTSHGTVHAWRAPMTGGATASFVRRPGTKSSESPTSTSITTSRTRSQIF